MKQASLTSRSFLPGDRRLSMLDRMIRRAVLRRLESLRHGSLTLIDGVNDWHFGTPGSSLSATIEVLDPRFYADVAFAAALGGGEAYFRGYWATDSLTDVVRIMARNRATLDSLQTGTARFSAPLLKTLHWLNRNTRHGSRRNIAAHYDLGNDFFALWLDKRMQYSSAVYEHEDASLDDAQLAKLERLCRKLQLKPDDHLLEIGTGWGGLAIHAASRYGCRVTTTTISAEQYAYAVEQVRLAGLQDRITVLQQDYRDLSGSYDKLVSVEMLEAVGHRYHATFFDKCATLLKPDGLMVLQSITIADQNYDRARRSVDFIQRYIFPGGSLPSVTSIAAAMTASSDMRISHIEDIGPHYARTLRHWHDRLFARRDEARRQGYSAEFLRMWQYYLCYCEGGFMERAIGNVQIVASRPLNRAAPFLA